MFKKLTIAVAALFAVSTYAGEWHTGQNNLCTDCHTMHFSMQHKWDGTTPVPNTPQKDGNWLSATGPNHYLLKAPVNEVCLACHDGQTFAPDVMGANFNAAPTQGRSAGALNKAGIADAGYAEWKGHTLDSTANPPGYNPAAVGIATDWYNEAGGLECISCHTQHGIAGVYRNLGPRGLGTANLPTYVINAANDTTKDVWINIPAPYVVNSGDPATFNPFYDSAKVSYNRNDKTVGTTKTSNGIDTQCATCHGNFHGGWGDTEIGGIVGIGEFSRHPTSQVTIGSLGGGHSALSQYTGATTKTKVYASDRTGYTDASPGCVSCHKAHGNKNPFGLYFLARNAGAVSEEGGYFATDPAEPANGYQIGFRNLCGQCHRQGP